MKPTHPVRRLAPAFLLAALAACDGTSLTVPARTVDSESRYLRAGPDSIAGQYIVVFEPDPGAGVESRAYEVVSEHGGSVRHRYSHALRGFSATLSPEAVEALLADPRVAYVAQDGLVELATTQTPATWGIDRIDQRDLPLNNTYNYTPTGAGVNVYVIDTGILTTHLEFGSRASVGTDFVGDGKNGQDCHGHGTHVAGTIGGGTYGVAKGANLIAVRVFNCAGSSVPNSTIVAAVDWVTANAVKPAVVNMSLGGGASTATNDAVTASIATGISYAVAAGNENVDACTRSPASVPAAITVASSTSTDARSSFSNWGSCTDLFAPGSDITSAWWTSTSATNTISGTSMATPHVAGVIALYLQGNPTATPAAVTSAVLNSATTGRITDLAGSVNRLLFSPLSLDVLLVNKPSLNLVVVRPPSGPTAAGHSPEAATSTRFSTTGSGPAKFEGVSPAGGGEATIASGSAGSPVTLSNGTASSVPWTSSSSQAWLTANPSSGTLASLGSQTVNLTARADSLAPGTYSGTVTFNGGGGSATVNVTLTVAEAVTLTSGVASTGLTGAAGNKKYFAIAVPAGADSLVISMDVSTGDPDLYVRRAAVPTLSLYDCRPYSSGGVDERCITVAPAADTYLIMIDAFGSYGAMSLVATVYGAPPATPPTAASNVDAIGDGPGKVVVSWLDNSGDETYFRLRRTLRNPDGSFAPYQIVGTRGPNNTSFLDSTVAIGSSYRYQVQTCNAVGCSYSLPSNLITVVLPPSAPAVPTATVYSADRVDLSWVDVGTETSYKIRRGTRNPDGSYTGYVTLKSVTANTTAYNDTSTNGGSTYRYQVQACNGGGCATSPARVISVPTVPAAPTGLAVGAVTAGQVSLTWTDASSNESQFRVRRSLRGAGGTFGAYATVATLGAGVTSHNDATVAPGNAYRYIVQACNAAGCANSTSVGVDTPGS